MPMKFRLFAVALTLVAATPAGAVNLYVDAFDVDVRMTTDAIGKDGTIDLKKLYVMVRSINDAKSVVVQTSLQAELNGKGEVIGVLGCGVGDLGPGQSSVYQALSCGPVPGELHLPAGAELWAIVKAKSEFSLTGTARIKVGIYPPGMTIE